MSISVDESNGVSPSFVFGESEISKIKENDSLYDLRILMSMGGHDA